MGRENFGSTVQPENKQEGEGSLLDILPEELRSGVESAAANLGVEDWQHHPIKLARALNPDNEPHIEYPDTARKFVQFLEEKGILS